jgi:polysaccharide export outer membrane protein
MFQLPEGTQLKHEIDIAEKNYVIQKYDYLELEVYTNKGERIIDPLSPPPSTDGAGTTVTTKPTYLVDAAGQAKFPMIDIVKLEGLTIRQAEGLLEEAYKKYYEDAYAVLRYTNKRVIVLGATGGQVIPLANENMKLVEVLALAQGLNNDAKAHNIRIMRADQVFVADLSTFDGYVKNNIPIQSGDIVYVEPVRRPLTESLRDYGPILTIITTLTTLAVVIIGLR